MYFNCHRYRALAEIFLFFNFLLFYGNKTGISLFYHGTKKEKGGRILMKIFMPLTCASSGKYSDFSVLSCSKGSIRGTHAHIFYKKLSL